MSALGQRDESENKREVENGAGTGMEENVRLCSRGGRRDPSKPSSKQHSVLPLAGIWRRWIANLARKGSWKKQSKSGGSYKGPEFPELRHPLMLYSSTSEMARWSDRSRTWTLPRSFAISVTSPGKIRFWRSIMPECALVSLPKSSAAFSASAVQKSCSAGDWKMAAFGNCLRYFP